MVAVMVYIARRPYSALERRSEAAWEACVGKSSRLGALVCRGWRVAFGLGWREGAVGRSWVA